MSDQHDLIKGSKTDLHHSAYTVAVTGVGAQAADLMAVLIGGSGQVRHDDDLVFFNNRTAPGVALLSDQVIQVRLADLPADVHRIIIAASTEAQAKDFGELTGLQVIVDGADAERFRFQPPSLTTETVLQLVALYRRGSGWRLDAIGQGYANGLASFAKDFGIAVDEPGAANAIDEPAAPPPLPAILVPAPIDLRKVSVTLTKDSPTKTATIDLRKSQGDPNWVLTVGLEWDGRDATYHPNGQVKKYGSGDLDVYFFCRNEETDEFVVISGDRGHRGDINKWPFVYHYGDSPGPGKNKKPAVEQVRVLPQENGDLLVNVYQSLDNGAGAIDTFGRPRCVIRYGRAGKDGLPGSDADEITAFVGNNKNSYWATVAHIDVQDGILTVDGETRYSRTMSEQMPGLDTAGTWVRTPNGGPSGQSKKRNDGIGLTHYAGTCPTPAKRRK